jgi:hypothetical protein
MKQYFLTFGSWQQQSKKRLADFLRIPLQATYGMPRSKVIVGIFGGF